jgi:hypothetical protein
LYVWFIFICIVKIGRYLNKNSNRQNNYFNFMA